VTQNNHQKNKIKLKDISIYLWDIPLWELKSEVTLYFGTYYFPDVATNIFGTDYFTDPYIGVATP
jgi:hypothetical protein